MYPTNIFEIIKLVNCQGSDKSPGFDNISAHIIKKVIFDVAEPLAHICNLSLFTGVVPDKLKVAKVTPLFKAGDANSTLNYRPISILPFFSKILEKLVFNRLYSYLVKKSILNDNQYCFRPKYSTQLAILDLVDKVVNAFNNKQYGIGIFLDLSKAFDTVNHDILLIKLHHYGIGGLLGIGLKVTCRTDSNL